MMDEKEKNKVKQLEQVVEADSEVEAEKENTKQPPLKSKVEENLKHLRQERARAKKQKKKDLISNIDLAEFMCGEESKKVLEEHKANFTFDHFCGEVKTIFVHEDLDCPKLTHSMLGSLREKIKTINKRWNVGIITSTKRAFGGDGGVDDLDSLDDLDD